MNVHTLGMMVIAFVSGIVILTGCSWENSLYRDFVDNGKAHYCPPLEKRIETEKNTFDFFYFGNDIKCTENEYDECVQTFLDKLSPDDKSYQLIAGIPYSDAFKYGVCPVGFECIQDSDVMQDSEVWSCYLAQCKQDEVFCGGLCIHRRVMHVASCAEEDDGDASKDALKCEPGYLDCNRDFKDGCEVSISETHIEACQNKGEITSISECVSGYLDCNGVFEDGCEIAVEGRHVSSCDRNVLVCEHGYLDCNGSKDDGCEVSSGATHITECDHFHDSIIVMDCEEGYADCNHDFTDGCEIDTRISREYCGADAGCLNAARCTGVEFCQNGKCVNDCEMTVCSSGSESNDVCVDLKSDERFCGDCSIDCHLLRPLNSTVVGCENGTCRYACLNGYEEIWDGDSLDCVDLKTHPYHCGAKDVRCLSDEGCLDGRCHPLDCGEDERICEVEQERICLNVYGSYAEHCGACNYSCPDRLPDPNAVFQVCHEGVCLYECQDGFVNCGTGEAPVCIGTWWMASDVSHCGGCGNQCAGDELCVDGKCRLAFCRAEEEVCFDGAERYCANLRHDSEHCGICGYSCQDHPLLNASSNRCDQSQCVYECDLGFKNCGISDYARSIRCLDVKGSDTQNCGDCGVVCPRSKGVGSVLDVCRAGVCIYQCSPGLSQCGTETAPLCYNLNTDVKHCGSCTNQCPASKTNAHLTGCSSGKCSYTCNSGYTNCGAATSPACYNLKSDKNHCGKCKTQCSAPKNATAACNKGKCSWSCNKGYKKKGSGCVKK